MREFPWPAPYTLKADADGVEIRLPHCGLYVTEGFESDMDLSFLPDSTGLDDLVSVGDAIRALKADGTGELPPESALINFFGPTASLEKVKSDVYDLLTYCSPTCARPSTATSSGLRHTARIRSRLRRLSAMMGYGTMPDGMTSAEVRLRLGCHR
jgi:hypothetical protein